MADQVTEAKISGRFNLFRCLVWLGIIPVSIFLGWIGSVAFVAACSLYANAASDWAAYRADKNPNAEQMDRIEAKLDKILGERVEGGTDPS